MPGANTGMGMDLGTQQALTAPEGKIIPALHGKQDLSLVNLPLVFPLESLIQNSPTCHKMPGLYDTVLLRAIQNLYSFQVAEGCCACPL